MSSSFQSERRNFYEKGRNIRKSRNEKGDEGKEFVFAKGRKSGFIGMLIVFCILSVFNLYNHSQETNFALKAMIAMFLDIWAVKVLECIL